MSGLTLTAKQETMPPGTDLSPLQPANFTGLDEQQIASKSITTYDGLVALGELFEITPGPASHLALRGDFTNCNGIGAGLTEGTIEVIGDVGDMLGYRMTSGTLTVKGNTGDFAFAELRGGIVRISGNVGDKAASSRSPMGIGMRGGTAIVGGNSGSWLAERMRRGTVVVYGNVGPAAATRMIAGTIAIGGQVDAPLGAGMKRGTIVFLTERVVPSEKPGFTPPEATELSFLPLLLGSLAKHLPPELQPARQREAFRSIGDCTAGGRAELIWLPEKQKTTSRVSHA